MEKGKVQINKHTETLRKESDLDRLFKAAEYKEMGQVPRYEEYESKEDNYSV